MDDLIRRQDGINEFMKATADGDKFDWCKMVLKQVQSAMPVQKKGKWLTDRGLYKCSNCNHVFSELWWVETCPIDRMNKYMRFCPQCGAEMGVDK